MNPTKDDEWAVSDGEGQEGSNRMSGAYDRIKSAIIQGTFTPGARLSQVKIAERLGLSRTPVREALRLIEKERLITSERGRQVVISHTSMADLDELYALRIKLDTTTVLTSVAELTEADLAEMKSCLDLMDANSSLDAFAAFDEAHRTFHMIAIRSAGPRHVDHSAQLNEHAERYRRLYLDQDSSYNQSRAEHVAILNACMARDGERVACLLAEHYARIALTIVARIEPQFEAHLVRSAVGFVLQGRSGPTRKVEVERQAAKSSPKV